MLRNKFFMSISGQGNELCQKYRDVQLQNLSMNRKGPKKQLHSKIFIPFSYSEGPGFDS